MLCHLLEASHLPVPVYKHIVSLANFLLISFEIAIGEILPTRAKFPYANSKVCARMEQQILKTEQTNLNPGLRKICLNKMEKLSTYLWFSAKQYITWQYSKIYSIRIADHELLDELITPDGSRFNSGLFCQISDILS